MLTQLHPCPLQKQQILPRARCICCSHHHCFRCSWNLGETSWPSHSTRWVRSGKRAHFRQARILLFCRRAAKAAPAAGQASAPTPHEQHGEGKRLPRNARGSIKPFTSRKHVTESPCINLHRSLQLTDPRWPEDPIGQAAAWVEESRGLTILPGPASEGCSCLRRRCARWQARTLSLPARPDPGPPPRQRESSQDETRAKQCSQSDTRGHGHPLRLRGAAIMSQWGREQRRRRRTAG